MGSSEAAPPSLPDDDADADAGALADVASCTGSSEAAQPSLPDDDANADAEMHHTLDYARRGAAGRLGIAPLELFSAAAPSPPAVPRPPAKPAFPESAAADGAAAPEANAGGGAHEEAGAGRQIAQGASPHVVAKGDGGNCCDRLRQECDSLLR
ncbi:Kinesin-like protein [Hordeum vulgare]|nr:Kinesin-like protein [Hordeum vulgare]